MVDVTYRTLGPWGSGKGANLQPSEVDANFYSLAQAIVDIQNNPEAPNGIETISVAGTQMTITLTDGTVMGPFTLPVLTFRWRGEYDGITPYAVLDVFTVTAGNPAVDLDTVRYGIFMVQIAGTFGTFDPDLEIGGEPAFLQLFGSTDDALLSTLADVAITAGPNEGEALVWDADTEKWVNTLLGGMAYQDSFNVAITGGRITGMLAPVIPDEVATKGYVDALPGGMTTDDRTMMSNIAGVVAPAIPNSLSDYLDYVLGTTVRGTMLFRGGVGWIALGPGAPGAFLQTLGAGVDLAWAPGASGVTMISAGTGISTGASSITGSGVISLAAIGDDTFLANTSGVSAAPVPTTLTAWLDSVLGTARGTIITRAVGGWVSLSPGLAGQYLKSAGTGADLAWDSQAGSGTLTSITAGTGISTGGAPITSTGAVSLAAIANNSLLANLSGGSAAPVPTTASLMFDTVFGATQGSVVYRNASTWVMLTPGTSGQVLVTGGAAANPSWANVPAGASVANQRLIANISGSTAAPVANTLSAIFDAILGSSRGMVVYRGSAGWAALAPGTSGQVLTTSGAAGDPHWAAGGGGGASISIGDTPPATPTVGNGWWDSLGGQLYLWFNDGTSAQWVPASNQPGPQGPAGAPGAPGTSIPLPVAVASGGTGAITAPAALTALGAAPLASPAFTGTPSLPARAIAVTQPAATSNTSIATTAYVQAQGYATSATVTTADNLRVLKAGDTMGPLSVTGAAQTLGASAGFGFEDRVTPGAIWQWYVTGGIARLNGGGDRFTVSSAGNVGIGVVSASVKLDVLGTSAAGTVVARIGSGPAGADTTTFMVQFLDFAEAVSVGAITRNGTNTVAYGTASDERLKDGIVASERGLAALMAIKVSDYRMGESEQQGLLAQNVAEVYPEAVVEGGDDPRMEPWLIDYGRLTPLLIRAVQELSAKVAALEGKPA